MTNPVQYTYISSLWCCRCSWRRSASPFVSSRSPGSESRSGSPRVREREDTAFPCAVAASLPKTHAFCLVLPQLGCAGHSPRCDCRSRRFVVAGARSADGHGGAPEVAAAGGHAFTRPAAVFTCVFRVLRHQPPPLQQRPAMAKHSNGHTRKIMANTEGAEVGSIDDPSGTDLRPTQQLSQTGRHRAAPARNGQVRRAHSVPVGLVGQQLVGRPPDQVPVEKRHTPC